MRKIDSRLIEPDTKWSARAKIEADKVAAGRKLSECKNIWTEAKERLKKVSFDKCWYCEVRQNRADDAVDHFRPKSIYPWLAFEIENFRFACTFCNSVRRNPTTGQSAGKGDHFPLLAGAMAANVEQLKQENPVLLDPCRGGDPVLLDFLSSGQPCAKHPDQDVRRKRAEDSIHYYHLNHPAIVEARRQLALQLKEWIEEADDIYCSDDQGSLATQNSFNQITACISRSITPQAEFSVFARRIVAANRDKPWVEDLLFCS